MYKYILTNAFDTFYKIFYNMVVMNEHILEELKIFGLQENEVKVYLALLEVGRSTVSQISKVAKLNRTTGYDVLERLCIYGIVSRTPVAKKKMYTPEPPSRLRQFLEAKKNRMEKHLKELEDVLPDLQSLYKTDLKPMIKFGEGKDEMENIYKHVLTAKSTVYSILNLKGYAEVFDELGTYQEQERYRRKIKEKVLAIKSDTATKWYNKTYKGKKLKQTVTEYRWIEKDPKKFPVGEINVFDDIVIVMLSKPGENVAFEIKSQSFADFLKIVFEMAWEVAGLAKK